MVTRSKPKQVADPYVGVTLIRPGKVADRFLPLLFETLNIDRRNSSSDRVQATIQSVLDHCARRLLFDERVSNPSSTRATLRPIGSQAAALAKLMDAHRLAPPVVRALGMTHDEIFALRNSLDALTRNAEQAIMQLATANTRGAHNAIYSNALKDVEQLLGDLFETLRADDAGADPKERAGDKSEFLKLCRGRLPAAPRIAGERRGRRQKGLSKPS